MRIPFAASAFVLMALCFAAGAQEAASPPVEKKTVTGTKDPLTLTTCVREDAPTGSRLGARKTCHTGAEWQTIRANAALDVQTLQERQAYLSQLQAQAGGADQIVARKKIPTARR